MLCTSVNLSSLPLGCDVFGQRCVVGFEDSLYLGVFQEFPSLLVCRRPKFKVLCEKTKVATGDTEGDRPFLGSCPGAIHSSVLIVLYPAMGACRISGHFLALSSMTLNSMSRALWWVGSQISGGVVGLLGVVGVGGFGLGFGRFCVVDNGSSFDQNEFLVLLGFFGDHVEGGVPVVGPDFCEDRGDDSRFFSLFLRHCGGAFGILGIGLQPDLCQEDHVFPLAQGGHHFLGGLLSGISCSKAVHTRVPEGHGNSDWGRAMSPKEP